MAKKATAVADAAEAAVATLPFSAKGAKKNDAEQMVVPLSKVHVEKGFNPRKIVGDLDELEASIKATSGLIHNLLVRPMPDKDGHFRIIAGERRYRALNNLGYAQVPVTVRYDLDNDLDAKAVAAAENGPEARRNLTPLELADMYSEFAKSGWTVKKIAKEAGANERAVYRLLELAKCDDKLKKYVEQGKLPVTVAVEVNKQDEDTREYIIERADEFGGTEELSLAKVKQLAKDHAKAAKADEAGVDGDEPESDGKKANKKKGKARAAAVSTWRNKKEVDQQLAEFAHILVNADGDEVGTTRYHEIRGAVAMALYFRGDLDFPMLPAVSESEVEADEKKQWAKDTKKADQLIKAAAKSYTPPDADTGDEAQEEEQGAEAGEPAETAAS